MWILPDRGWNPVPGIARWILNHGPPGESSVSISLPCTELPWASTQLSWFWRYWLSVGTPGDYTSFPGRMITNCVGGGWGRKVLQCGFRITRSLGRDSSKLARLLLHFLGDLRKPRQPVWKSSRPGEQLFWIPEVINRVERRGDLRTRGGAGVSLFWKACDRHLLDERIKIGAIKTAEQEHIKSVRHWIPCRRVVSMCRECGCQLPYVWTAPGRISFQIAWPLFTWEISHYFNLYFFHY